MNNRSKVALLSLLSNLAWFILAYLWQQPRILGLTGEDLARSWGIFFLVLSLGFSVLNVLGTLLVMAIEKRQGGSGFEEKTDERDRHIERIAMRVFGLILSLGFLAACALLALNLGLHAFFTTLAFTVILAALGLWSTYLIGYERGL